VAIGGPNSGHGDPAAQLADFIEKARALDAKYRAQQIRYNARARIMPVTRDMLAAALEGDLASLSALVWSVRDETYQRVLTLCAATAGYVAADVSRRPHADCDALEVARLDAERENAIRHSEAVARAYATETALGIRPAEAALLDSAKAARLTITMTARMVFRFRPAGLAWWQYLDHAWESSVAEQVLDLWCPRSLASPWLRACDVIHHMGLERAAFRHPRVLEAGNFGHPDAAHHRLRWRVEHGREGPDLGQANAGEGDVKRGLPPATGA
jgi:hypothetical protein